MADNLKFPIYFDLDGAVSQASKDWNDTYSDKLEKSLGKRPVKVKLSFDLKNIDKLDDVKKRLEGIKITPITKENQQVLKDLVKDLRELAKALQGLEKFKGIQLPKLQRAMANKLNMDTLQAPEKLRLAQERVRLANERLILSQQRVAEQNMRTGRSYKDLGGYVDRLVKRIAVYYSINKVSEFLTNVREVTAEFELQRISLGAILNNQENANALFSQIKSFALTSPVKILDLTKYTKQLAAYKIGYDELFETTKRLTDVSVGLGVAMDRVILAYGQVRATGYLRASEIRQFNEMGIPIVDELSRKLSQMKGELVSAADVMELVSKRGVSFELVKDVFNDLTSAGGMFYNMQEKQGNTLYGMWAKLGDAASVMYEEIGDTEGVNNGMQRTIEILTTLMRNWEAVAKTIATVGGIMSSVMLVSKAITKGEALYNAAVLTAMKQRTKARLELTLAEKLGTHTEIEAARAALDTADANIAAAIAEQKRATTAMKLGAGLKSIGLNILKMAGITAVITAVTYLAYKLFEAWENSVRLKRELSTIGDETGMKISSMVTNFEALARKSVSAADGSREQKEALEELQRTYRDIIPVQNLTIEKLREMKGEYTNLTAAIREYVRQTQLRRGVEAINTEYGKKLLDAERKMKKQLMEGVPSAKFGTFFKMSEDAAGRVVQEFKRLVLEGKSAKEAIKGAFVIEGFDSVRNDYDYIAQKLHIVTTSIERTGDAFNQGFYKVVADKNAGFAKLLVDEQKAIDDFTASINRNVPSLGMFTKYLDAAKTSISNYIFTTKEGTYGRDIETAKVSINAYIEAFKKALKEANVNINLNDYISIGFNGIPKIDFTALNIALSNLKSDFKVPLQNFSATVQGIYDGFVPPEKTVNVMRQRFVSLASSVGVSMDNMKYYLMNAGETWESYSKRIRDAIKSIGESIAEMRTMNAIMAGTFSQEDIRELEKRLEFFKLLEKYLKPENKSTTTKPKKEDNRLQVLNEIANTLKSINKEYEDLAKKEGNAAALSDMETVYAKTLQDIKNMSRKYKFNLPSFGIPTDSKDLSKYLSEIRKAMAKLPKSSKDVLKLQVEIDKINIDEKQRQIENQLKELADRISKTKIARDFYNKILSQTGDIELSKSVSTALFGNIGDDLFKQTVEQIKELFKTGDNGVDVQLDLKVQSAIDVTNERINYERLAEIYEEYKDKIIEKNRSTAESIIKEGQNVASENILSFEKELAKAKDYEQQRTDVIKREAQRRAEIIKSTGYTLPQKDEKLELSRKKEEEDISAINYEEFTKSEDYIRMFQNLSDVSRKSLIRLREELKKFIKTNQSLSPENMKALAKALDDIENQISSRGIGNDMVNGLKEYFAQIQKIKTAKSELQTAQTEYNAALPTLDADIESAKQKEIEAQTKLNKLKDDEHATDNEIVAAQLKLNQAQLETTKAVEAKANAAKKVQNAEKKVSNEQDKQKKASNKFFEDMKNSADTASSLAGVLGDVKDLLQISDESAAGLAFDAAIQGLQTMSQLFTVITTAQVVFNAICEANPWMLIATAIAAAVAAFQFISARKVKKANEEIERQQKLIDELQYSYSKLEKLVEKTFGKEYISNYNLQIKNLQAQYEAELKKAEAEKSKGKKEDEDKTQEYLDNARDAKDKLIELQEEFVSSIVGTDVASAAKDFAEEWLDAYLSFSDTTEAITEKFNEMIKNLVVNQALGGVVKNILKPFYDKINALAEDGEISTEEIASVMSSVPNYVQTAVDGLNLAMESLRKAGFDVDSLREDSSNLKGISRDIATASEESINGLAAGINTQNFYISQIHENVMLIAKRMCEGYEMSNTESGSVMSNIMAIQNQHLASLPLIEYNTAETVKRCERAAIACENIYNVLGKVVKPAGTKPSYTVCTSLT